MSLPRHRLPGLFVGLATAFFLTAGATFGQTYIPGLNYYGRSNYIQYAAGDLPFILSAPHGGTLNPAEIPDRTNCPSCSGWDFATATDTATDDVAVRVRTALAALTGHLPHIIICHVDRSKIDCNRAIGEGAQGNAAAMIAWTEFQNFINVSSNAVITNFGRGFYIDQHGQGHPEQRLELGYLLDKYDLTNSDTRLDAISSFKNSSSIRTLANSVAFSNSFSKLLRGPNSFGEGMVAEGYPATPSYSIPVPFTMPTSTNAFFNGGYNTSIHGSDNGGPLNALQIEANYTGVRDSSANRIAYAQSLARVLEKYFGAYFGINLRSCAPTVWDVGGGSWSNTNNWALGILPVSSNLLFFAGSGGSVNHDLAALSAANGVVSALVFSNAASGAYTISGNAIALNGGITSDNAFNNAVNNNLTLPANSRIAINSGALSLGGILSGGGFTKLGEGTLALTAINTFSGTVSNLAGTISLNGTSTFGNGLLVLGGGDILSLNTRSVAPISNSILMTADTTISGNGTLTNSTRILPLNSDNITATGGTLNIRNIGLNPYASNNIFRLRFNGGGFDFSQPIQIGDAADLPVAASQVESYNDDTHGDQIFSGAISGPGQFRRDAASVSAAGRTILSGTNSYSGGTVVSAGTLLVNNTSGSGTGTGSVSVGNDGVLAGSGVIAGSVVCAGAISGGDGVGILAVGGLDLSGGTNIWDLSSLTDGGPGANFDQIVVNGGALTLGGSSVLQLRFIPPAMPPTNSNPFWMMSHSWRIVSLTNGATNPGATRFATISKAAYATGAFTNFSDAAGNIMLSYVAVAPQKPVVQSFLPTGAGSFDLISSAETNRTYVLQSAANLTDAAWDPVSTNIASGSLLVLTNLSGSDPMRFYRLVVMP